MAKIGSIYAVITGDKRPLDKALVAARKSATKGAAKIQSALKKINFTAVGVGAAAAGAAIVYAMKKSVDAASRLEETTAKFGTVFGEQVKLANMWTRDLVNDYAMSTREARQYLGAMQDLLVPMGMNANAAAKMSNSVVQLAADLGSFNNLETENVMRDIQSALVGNFETMKKYGVVLNAVNVAQKALTMGIVANKKELTAAHKAQAAYQLIIEGSTFAIGDMARTSDSYANQTKKMNALIEDSIAAIGKGLLPGATKVVTEMNNWIKANAKFIEQDMPNALSNVAGAIGGIISALAGKSEAEELNETIIQIRKSIDEISQSAAPGRSRMIESLNAALDRTQRKLDNLSVTWDETHRMIGGADITPLEIANIPEFETLDLKMLDSVREREKQRVEMIKQGDLAIALNKRMIDTEVVNASAHAAALKAADERQYADEVMAIEDEIASKQKGTFSLAEKTAESAASSMSNTFSDVFMDGITGELDSLKSYTQQIFKSILGSFVNMAAKMAATKLFGAFGFEDGGAFASGGAFSNSVVSKPSLFKFAGGTGLMGEAGPEAIMPLARTSGGELGVKASGGGADGSQPVAVYNKFEIQALDARSLVELMHDNPEAIIGPFTQEIEYGNRDLVSKIKGLR